jgi:hypothetical protein
MKNRRKLVDMDCEFDPIYSNHVVHESGQDMLYMHIMRAINGLFASGMLFYQTLTTALFDNGFGINPYHPCTASRQVEGSQIPVLWHVDDHKSSHANSKILTQFCTAAQDHDGAIILQTQFLQKQGRLHQC